VAVRRGDIVIAAVPGDFGKPRPTLIIQSDIFNDDPASVVVCPLTTELLDLPVFRIAVAPTAANGLRAQSQVMIDKLAAVRPQRLRETIGSLDDQTLRRVDGALAVFLGLA
jgi:mRNA interferase MazF